MSHVRRGDSLGTAVGHHGCSIPHLNGPAWPVVDCVRQGASCRLPWFVWRPSKAGSDSEPSLTLTARGLAAVFAASVAPPPRPMLFPSPVGRLWCMCFCAARSGLLAASMETWQKKAAHAHKRSARQARARGTCSPSPVLTQVGQRLLPSPTRSMAVGSRCQARLCSPCMRCFLPHVSSSYGRCAHAPVPVPVEW